MTWGTRFFTARADDLLGDTPGAAHRADGR